MTWFADLSECSYFGDKHTKYLRAVGWLDRGKPFLKERIDEIVFRKLSQLFEDPWQPLMFMGWHECNLCPGRSRAPSHRNLFIPGNDVMYVSPEGILHYITKHSYAPPSEFKQAVIACPPMSSGAYFAALGDLARQLAE